MGGGVALSCCPVHGFPPCVLLGLSRLLSISLSRPPCLLQVLRAALVLVCDHIRVPDGAAVQGTGVLHCDYFCLEKERSPL